MQDFLSIWNTFGMNWNKFKKISNKFCINFKKKFDLIFNQSESSETGVMEREWERGREIGTGIKLEWLKRNNPH